MEYEQIEAIVAVLRDSPKLTELEVRTGDICVRLRRPEPPKRPAARGRGSSARPQNASAVSSPTATEGSPPSLASLPGTVTAHLVGVFRPLRTAPVSAGDTVKEGQVLGQIEAMRLMNDISATAAGVVSEVFVQEGQPVQYGQVLFSVVPTEDAG